MDDLEKPHPAPTDGPLGGDDGKRETMWRLCRILGIVHDRRFGWASGSCDCLCPGRAGKPESSWRSTGEALRWLEKLVEALPKGNVDLDVVERWSFVGGERQYHDIAVKPLAAPDASKPEGT